MTPPEAPTRAYLRADNPACLGHSPSSPSWPFYPPPTRRHRSDVSTPSINVSLTSSVPPNWRFNHLDQQLLDLQRTVERRFNQLDRRLDKELWDHRLSHQDLWRTQGIVSALRDIVRGLQKEVAYLRQLIEPSQPSARPLPTSASCCLYDAA